MAPETKPDDVDVSQAQDEPKPKLNLEVDVAQPSSCVRHVVVRVSRGDVDRYMKEAFDDLRVKAEVPGFRPGRAPRKLVETRFKDQVSDQVKGSLLMDSIQQITEDQDFSAISEPDIDFEAVTLPDEGDFTFEFDIEVRPEFDAPQWEGLKLERYDHSYSDEEIEKQLQKLLARYGTLEASQEPVQEGDVLDVEFIVTKDGKEIARFEEEGLQVRPTISFRDSSIEGFVDLVKGAKAGDSKQATVTISDGAANAEMSGQEVAVQIAIKSVSRTILPKLTPEFLDTIGGFEDEDELREVVRNELERRFNFHRQRHIRSQITAALTKDASWDLPPDLVRRQTRREFERAILELRSAGFSEDQIRAHANALHRNSAKSTEAALKEHFILERIAEDKEVDVEEADYDTEIMLIAASSDESPRRVRARLEKRGQMDALRNQILERKVIEIICEKADFKDIPLEGDMDEAEHAIDRPLSGGREQAEIPEAKHAAGDSQALPTPADHT